MIREIYYKLKGKFYKQYEQTEEFKKKFLYFGNNTVIESPSRIYGVEYIRIGDNTSICANSRVNIYSKLSDKKCRLNIGNNCFLGYNLSILVGGEINIGDDALIASNVLITSENHGMNAEVKESYANQPLIGKSVTIERGCWIGEKVCILPGVIIGERSIIGAGSIVTKSIPKYCIAVGNPAQVIKTWDFNAHKWVNIMKELKEDV